MRRPGRVVERVRTLRGAGGGRLQVVSDFDLTLSRFAHGGKRCPSSYSILENSKVVSEECRRELAVLFDHYYPIEIDPQQPMEEKLPHMVEWEGYKTFFDTLHRHDVPLFIFSTGTGDVLEEVIRQRNVLHPNIHIVSNYMDFSEDVEEQRECYLDSYNIVLERDETLDVVNGLLQHILCPGELGDA